MAMATTLLAGCMGPQPKPYGEERKMFLPGEKRLVWAVAPAVNLSGESHVDPLLNSDIVYQELQQVDGLTVVPVNRVAEVYASLKIDKIQSEAQAYAVCDLLGCDGLVVPTITVYDPYNPPKLGASLQLFLKPGAIEKTLPEVDPRELERSPTVANQPLPMQRPQRLMQAVGMFDSADGTIRREAEAYSVGRSDPNGPMAPNEVYLSMDRYCGFVYHQLIAELIGDLNPGRQ
jgi:hypothetical protein